MADRSGGYIPSHKRAESPPPMRLTERDRRIILAVHAHRILSAPQIEALFFPSDRPRGCRTSCQRRLQLLYHHGYLERIQIPVVLGEGRHPFVYALDDAGAALVASALGLDRADLRWRPKRNVLSPQFVDHLLLVNEFRVALKCLAQTTALEIREWVDESQFRLTAMKDRVPFRLRGSRIIRNFPDGYFAVGLPDRSQDAHFFLEVDLGTETNARWRDKVRAYTEYRDRGLSAQHYGTRNFRLLAITTTPRRLNNLKRATEKGGGDHYFWLTTQESIDIWQPQKLLEPIWSVATRDEPLPLFADLRG